MIRTTRTYALLAVSPSAFQEIASSLRAAGYSHAFDHDEEHGEIIDLHGLALVVGRGQAVAPSDLFVLVKRGLFWRPNAAGYADGILYAGAYSPEDAEGHARGSSGEVSKLPLLDAINERLGERPHLDARVLRAALAKLEPAAEGLCATSHLFVGYPSRCTRCGVYDEARTLLVSELEQANAALAAGVSLLRECIANSPDNRTSWRARVKAFLASLRGGK